MANQGYAEYMKKVIAKAIEDAAKGVSRQQQTQGKDKQPITVNLAVNVKAPEAEKQTTQTERVGERLGERAATEGQRQGNVWLTQEAAKGGFYGGTTYAQQMRGRFVAAGYAVAGQPGMLVSHYAEMVGGHTAGAVVDGALIALAVAKYVGPVLNGIIGEKMKAVDVTLQAVKAEYGLDLLKLLGGAVGPMSGKSVGEAAKRLGENPLGLGQYGTPSLQKAFDDLQATVTKIEAAVAYIGAAATAGQSNALNQVLLSGGKVDIREVVASAKNAGEYAAWQQSIKSENDAIVNKKVGAGTIATIYNLCNGNIK